MLRILVIASTLAAASALAGCQSGPTPYQARAQSDRGYAESRIESDRYRISFKGNSMTDRATVEDYMLFRAAELTLQNGFDTFTIVDRDTDKTTDFRNSGSGFGSRLSYMYFSPRYGWAGAWDPFWTPSSFREVTRYEAFAEIVMNRGSGDRGANVFEAREVSQNLAGRIQRPEI